MQFLPPERVARLLAEAYLRVQEGKGHAFHGNQWTALGEGPETDRFPPISDDPAPGRTHYYHATDAVNLITIAEEGLKLGHMAPISLTPHLEAAHFWGSNVNGHNTVLLRVPRRRVQIYEPEDPDWEYDPMDESAEVATFRPIKADDLEVYNKGRWAPLSKLRSAGEGAGHRFHGNQWTDRLAGMNVVGEPESKMRVERALQLIPDNIRAEVRPATIHAFKTQAETTDKIDEYLMKHYGFTSEGQAKRLTDRDTGTIFTTDDDPELLKGFASLFEQRLIEITPVTPDRSKEERERDFVNAFADLITGHHAQELMSLSNPITAILERKPIMDAFRRWGWA